MDRGPIAPVDARLDRLHVSRRLGAIEGHPGAPDRQLVRAASATDHALRRRGVRRPLRDERPAGSQAPCEDRPDGRSVAAGTPTVASMPQPTAVDRLLDGPLSAPGLARRTPWPRCCAWRRGSATGAACGSRLVNWWSAEPMRLSAVMGVIAGCRPAGKRRGSRRRCLLGHLSDSGQRLVRPERSSHRQAPQRMLLALRTTRRRKSQGRCCGSMRLPCRR
jgi:hypothetical protein